jgi:quercetin dioxygenase-like cupin family protein
MEGARAKHFETFYLLSGEAEWTIKKETNHIKAGDAVYIPANALHSAKTLGTKPAHFILIYSHGDYEAHLERQASTQRKSETTSRSRNF